MLLTSFRFVSVCFNLVLTRSSSIFVCSCWKDLGEVGIPDFFLDLLLTFAVVDLELEAVLRGNKAGAMVGTDGGANGGADGGAMEVKDGVGNGGVGAKEGAETFRIGEVENATIEGEQTGVDFELFVDTNVVLIVDVDLIADELGVEDGVTSEHEDLRTAMRRGRSESDSVWSSRRSTEWSDLDLFLYEWSGPVSGVMSPQMEIVQGEQMYKGIFFFAAVQLVW